MSDAFRFPRAVLALAALLLAACASSFAQDTAADGNRRFRSGVDVVQVTVTVRDARGRLVGDLARSDFELSEDGVRQEITHFDWGRVPVSLGVALDVSQSMYGQRMAEAQQALRRFLVELLDPSDEAFLVVFNHDPHLRSPWTKGPSRAYGRLEDVRPYGATAIYDALGMALPLFAERSHARAALVLISDGSDTASDATPTDVRRQIRRSDAFIYAVGIDAPERRPINDQVNVRLLREITGESGGYTEVIHDSVELVAATERIAEELRHQYSLGYTPSASPDGRYRRIRVRVRDGDYDVRARRGYVASARP